MPIAITIPRLGWNMEEGTFVGWLKQDGDRVRPGDTLFSLESEKATQDIECLDNGILRIPPNGPEKGTTLAVGAVIGYLVQAGEAAPFEQDGGKIYTEGQEGAKTSISGRDPPISPRARRLAEELGIDWTHLRGSGRTGRIREKDVRAAAPPNAPDDATRPGATTPPPRALPVTPIRRVIAQHMLASVRSTAPVTLTSTADAANLVNLRNQFKAVAPAGKEPVPSYTDFLVKLAAAALQDHPLLNASWASDQIELAQGIHVGIAVDTDAGLLVPILRDVPGLSLRQIAAQARDLITRAQQGKLRAKEMQDGTFTVTNLGTYGVEVFTPIINYPQSAILGLGRIRRQPVAMGDQVVLREQVTLSLTFDHRIVDGAPAARFLQTLCRFLENPGPRLVS
jgi:pyruvate dehydrogenase E2 component (dihydrolipoamide acetyltransferase)